MRGSDHFDFLEQTAVHQLLHAADDIEDHDGFIVSFDYDEEIDDYVEDMGAGIKTPVTTERTVTLELTYLLPE